MIDHTSEIHERERLEAAVRAAEERFRTLVQLSFDVYWESDAEHRFTRQEFSNALADAPQAGSEIGKTRWEVPHVEPDEEAWRQHRATLDAHLPFRDFELARPTADGGKRYVSVSGFPVFDGNGRFIGYRGVGRHITDRKRAEAEHRAYVWFLESIDRINRAMHRSDDLERTVADVLDAVVDIFHCDRAWLVYPCDPHAESWRALAERVRERAAKFVGSRDVAMDADMAAVFGAALAGDGAVTSLPEALAERFGIGSQMAMALHPKDDAPYLFGLHRCARVRAWSHDERRLFEAIGRRLGDALTNLLMFRKLRESERRLEAAQRVARIGWWERDFVHGRVSLSDEACRIFGVQPVDLPQWHGRWLSLIHPDDRASTAAASDAAVRGGPRYDAEYRVVRPDGTVRVVHSQGDVTRDESGRAILQFGVMQDITELRAAEQQLRARQELLDLAQKAARAVAFDWYIGARENENHWSPELEAMYGLEPGTFDGTFQGWKKLLHPDDWPAVKAAILYAQQSGDVAAEYRVVHKDGSEHWLRAKGRMFFDTEGQPERMVGFMFDVTDRHQAEEALRESEARFRTLFDHATDAFFLIDLANGSIIEVNRRACENLGYTRDELIGKTVFDLDADLSAEWLERNIRPRIDAGETVTFETRHRRKDGSVFPVEMRARIFQHGGQKVNLSVARDITERKRLEEERERLRRLEAQIAHANRVNTMGELTASIAHEVNQPLGAMVANAAACGRWLAARPPEVEKARRALDSISADGRRAAEIIARVRALTKRQVQRKGEIDMNRTILEVLALADDQLRSRDIVVQTRLEPQLPVLLGDVVQLQQVLLNLIVNASDAMSAVHDRPRQLKIVSRRDGPSAVAVEVRDSGTGLEPGHATRLFEPFYTTKADGLGVGLSISRSIIEAHGGDLCATPNEPHGAVFRFSLPVEEEESA